MPNSRWNEIQTQFQQLEFDNINALSGLTDVDQIDAELQKAKKQAYEDAWFGVWYLLEYPVEDIVPPLDYDVPSSRDLIEKAINDGRSIRTIIDTEIHNIYTQGQEDAAEEIEKTGVILYKQWDATLDAKTRDTHVLLDGTIKRRDEYFETINGKGLAPGKFGVGEEDCNCRCMLRYSTYG